LGDVLARRVDARANPQGVTGSCVTVGSWRLARTAWAVGIAAAAFLGAAEGASAAQCGKAAWFDLDGLTASGERANSRELTAAHPTLPFDTRVKVENLSNGRSVVVRVNDRGPYGKGRVIDVSRAAAEKLGFINAGVARVRVTVVGGKAPALPDSCGSGAPSPAQPEIVTASAEVALPEPRLRPDAVIGDGAEVVEAVATTSPGGADAVGAPPADPGQGVDGAVLAERFADAFAPEPAEPELAEPLREKAQSGEIVPMPADPHQGAAPREDWDHLQQVPD